MKAFRQTNDISERELKQSALEEKLKKEKNDQSNKCPTMDEIKTDMMIVGYNEAMNDEDKPLEEAVCSAAHKFGKSTAYVKKVYESA